MSEILTAIAILFILAGPFLFLANRYNIAAAPLLIVAGIIGGIFIDEQLALELAELGIALLVFAFGVRLQFSDIEEVITESEIVAFAQILVLGALGVGFGMGMGVSLAESLFIGVAVALSSTMVGTALLETEIRLNLMYGRLGQSIQLIQDLVAVLFILIVSAGVFELDPAVLQIGYGVVFVLGAVVVNRYVFKIVSRLSGGSDELLIIGTIAILVLFIGAAVTVDVPIVVGAFAAGLAIKYDPVEYLGLLNGLKSIEDFFVAIFFMTVGALVVIPFVEIGPVESVTKLVLVGGIVVLTAVIKPLMTVVLLIKRGYEARTATLVGVSTDQVSEFALVIAIQASLVGLLSQDVFDAIILAAAITMITTSMTQRHSERLYQRIRSHGLLRSTHRKIDSSSHVPADISDHVIVIGYGRAGSRAVDTLEELGHPYVVIENDPALIGEVRANCEAYVIGDAVEAYSWEVAQVEQARAVVSMTPSMSVSEYLLSLDLDCVLVLRSVTEADALSLMDRGATYSIVPDLLAAEELIVDLSAVLSGRIDIETFRERGLTYHN